VHLNLPVSLVRRSSPAYPRLPLLVAGLIDLTTDIVSPPCSPAYRCRTAYIALCSDIEPHRLVGLWMLSRKSLREDDGRPQARHSQEQGGWVNLIV
jgi:hypothetical protein